MNPEQLTGVLLAASLHEIKNRFGVLYNQLDSVLVNLDATQSEPVNRIKAEADFIGHELVRILVAYKHLRAEAGISVDQQFVAEFLEDCIARHGYTQAANQTQISWACDDDLTGFFDAQLLNIVLDTLIYNAIKANAKHLRLTAFEQDNWLHIQCDDNGPGFPADFPSQIDAPGQLTLESASTGLGLFLATQMVKAHQEGDQHGNLQLARSPDLGGARIDIALPQ